MADEVHIVTMPKLGETVTEGTVGRWLKSVGDVVAFDDPLFEVSTDKVDSEVPSAYEGTLLQVDVAEGETVPVGTALAHIGPAGASVSGAAGATPAPAAAAAAPSVAALPVAPAPVETAIAPTSADVHSVKMPKLGETVTEGTIGRWLKSVGDAVAFDDPLFEVSTDKVDSEVPSAYDGVLLSIMVGEGETAPVGAELARIGPVGAAANGASPVAHPTASANGPKASGGGNGAPAASRPGNTGVLSPVVRRLVADNAIDVAQLSGSGSGGRVTRDDVLAAIAAGGTPAAATTPAPAIVAAPAATPAAPAAKPQPAPAPVARAGEQVVPLSRIRIVTAQRMLQSRQTSPHVWTSVEVDLERIEQLRQLHKAEFKKQEGASLTYLPFIARATCDALRAFPAMNASVDMASKTMTFHSYVNLAIAVDLNEQGLMAPVIKAADSLNLRGMARAIKGVGDAAKSRTLKSDDLTGSTFTLTNPGPLGSFASAAVINQPNVAIMSTEGVSRRPTVVGDAIAIHHLCILGLSYDHRALDGVTASRFLLYVRDALQDRDWQAEVS